MIISEVMSFLRESTIKQVKVGESDLTVKNFINMGILEIHKRIRMAYGEAVISRVDGTYLYFLSEDDANVSIDLSVNDVLFIECLVDSDNEEVALNKLTDVQSSTTPQYNSIKLASSEDSDTYTAIYRASPKFLYSDSDMIPMSNVFLDPLFHWVAHLAHLSVTGDDNTQHTTHSKMFENSIARISSLGLYNQPNVDNSNLYSRGFQV